MQSWFYGTGAKYGITHTLSCVVEALLVGCGTISKDMVKYIMQLHKKLFVYKTETKGGAKIRVHMLWDTYP